MKTFLKILLCLGIALIAVWGILNALYHFGLLDFRPPLTIWEQDGTSAKTTEQPAEPEPAAQNEPEPEVKKEPTAPPPPPPTSVPTATPTLAPTSTPSPSPTPSPTPEQHATYRKTGEITVKIGNEQVTIITRSYEGGYILMDDLWLHPAESKENENSYSVPLFGKTLQELVYNWIIDVPKSAHQLSVNLFLAGLVTSPEEDFETATNNFAFYLSVLPSSDYDAWANKWLTYIFEKLNGGSIEKAQKKHGYIATSTQWDLELYMTQISETDLRSALHARVNHDDDTGEEADELFAIYDKNGKNILGAPKDYFKLICKAAGVNPSDYDSETWINPVEGGTHKWKVAKKKGSDTPGKTTETPTSTPNPEGNHKKDKNARPTNKPGTGGTNPADATDSHTTQHNESTPPPVTTETATEAPTQPPRAEPTQAPDPDCYVQGSETDDTKSSVPTTQIAGEDRAVKEQGIETNSQGVNNDESWYGSDI